MTKYLGKQNIANNMQIIFLLFQVFVSTFWPLKSLAEIVLAREMILINPNFINKTNRLKLLIKFAKTKRIIYGIYIAGLHRYFVNPNQRERAGGDNS